MASSVRKSLIPFCATQGEGRGAGTEGVKLTLGKRRGKVV